MERPIFPKSLQSLPYFSDVIESCDGCTEASPAFLFSAGFVAATAILGRRVALPNFPRELYPNSFIVLTGESGGSRKSACISLASLLTERADPCVHNITSIATAEGLVRMFALPQGRLHGGEHDINETDEKESKTKELIGVDKYLPPDLVEEMLINSSTYEGFRGLATIDELADMLQKAKNSQTGGSVLKRLCEFYNSPSKVSNSTSTNPTTALNPCLSLIAGIPEAWLGRNYKLNDIEGGLGRRFIFISDDASNIPDVPFPMPPHEKPLNSAIMQLHKLRERYNRKVTFQWGENTTQYLREFYTEFRKEKQHIDDAAAQAIHEGKDSHIRKAALLFAALDDSEDTFNTVTLKHLGFARDWAEFIHESQQCIFGNYSATEKLDTDKKVIEFLRGKGWVAFRNIYRGLSIDSNTCKQTMEGLTVVGQISMRETKAGNGRTVTEFSVDTEI